MADERGTSGRNPAIPWDLLDRGDPGFVDALRAIHDADALAAFALWWFQDGRPASRRLLFEYLDRPLNAFRHEAFIKRLFKLAEAARDDALMARFLVLFDRSIRRVRRRKLRQETQRVANQAEAAALLAAWKARGIQSATSWQARAGGVVNLVGYWPDQVVSQPRGTEMPRGKPVLSWGWDPKARRQVEKTVPDWSLNPRIGGSPDDPLPPLDRLGDFRLFSVATRKYLRRRAWRYFRNLGRQHPDRYVKAAGEALALYRDEDSPDGLALLDNWGLVHLLFHDSPSLVAKATGWALAEGRSLAELAPSPAFAPTWDEAPRAVVELMGHARSRTVRQWAIRRIREHPEGIAEAWPVDERIDLLGHEDPDVVALAAEWLQGVEGLDALGFERWVDLIARTDPSALDILCELVRRHVRPDEVTLDQAADLATRRPSPLARLGLDWLKARAIGEDEVDALMARLLDAACVPIRPDILGWLRGLLANLSEGHADRAIRLLDSRHDDARAEGWAWFLAEPKLRDDVALWRKLAESPHDDIRLGLVGELERRVGAGDPGKAGLGPESLRSLWAAVLLNVHRGNRAKPIAVRQLLRSLERNPDAAPDLLPLLGVALRSVRGPERRAGLVAVVQLVGRRPGVEPLARASFPELLWS